MSEPIGMLGWLDRAQKASQNIQASSGRLAGELAKSAGQVACNAANSRPGEWLLNTSGKAFFDEVCGPHWDANGYGSPAANAPFAGGQCSGVSYYVEADLQFQTIATGQLSSVARIRSAINQNRNVPGPVQGVGVFNQFPNQSRIVWFGNDIKGDMINASNNAIVYDPTKLKPFISSILVSPLTPECGDPPPEFTPGTAPDTPYGSPTTVNINNETYNITPIQPTIDIDGNISIPVEIDGTLFDLVGDGDGAPYTGDGPAQPGSEQPGSNSPEEPGAPDDFPNPPPGREWAGAVVRLTVIPPGTGGIPQSEPNTIFPRVMGNARLRMRLDDGTIVLGEPIQIKAKDELLWRPSEGLEVIGVFCNVVPLAEYSVTPLSIPIPGEEEPIPIGV